MYQGKAASQSEAVVHRHGDLLLGPEVPLSRLNRRMPQQELDLLDIPTRLPAELRAGAPQIVSAEPFDPDLFGRLLDDRPDRPVA